MQHEEEEDLRIDREVRREERILFDLSADEVWTQLRQSASSPGNTQLAVSSSIGVQNHHRY